MAIYIHTSDPKQLLSDIKKYIEDGKIKTWTCDSDGDFTHNVDQWRNQAWLRPFITPDKLIFGILCRRDKNVSVRDYAVYHGRFVEMILTHFDTRCGDVIATSKVSKYDKVKATNPQ